MIIIHNISKDNNNPLYIQIYEYFKTSIINGELEVGEKLPSIRKLSSDLGVSTTTVENAYMQLEIEGFIVGKPRRGLFVEKIEKLTDTKKEIEEIKIIDSNYKNLEADFDSFDFKLWQKYINKTINEKSQELLKVPSVNGTEILRKEIGKYSRELRGVNCHYNQVVIASGTQRLLGMLSLLLKDGFDTFAFESPGYKKGANVFKTYGYDLVEIPMIESEIDIGLLNHSNVKLLYVSPSHQYPTGTVMPYNNRINLLNWAKERNGYIIEDDYNSILRYDVNPISSLQGLSNNNEVIYIGSFSNLLLPSIRISYMILPKNLVSRFEEMKNKFTQGVSVLEQLTLANFMSEGSFDRHLRKLKKIQKRKSEYLVSALEKYPYIEVVSAHGGLNILFKANTYKARILTNAIKMKLKIEEVADDLLLFTYSGLELAEIEKVINKLFYVEEM